MKSLIIFIFCGFLISGCSKKGPRDFIIGKWRVTDVSSTPLAGSFKNATIEFKKDGTWTITGTPAPDQGGAYSFSSDYKTLTTTDVRGEQSPSDILELSKEQLILIDKK
ncbi:MAG: lipocalin family protein, partial [Chitinophagaceae bacterium]